MDPRNRRCIVLEGNLSDGYTACGPYENFDEAAVVHEGREAWILPLNQVLEEDDDCPNCGNGTLGLEDNHLVCRGECGHIFKGFSRPSPHIKELKEKLTEICKAIERTDQVELWALRGLAIEGLQLVERSQT